MSQGKGEPLPRGRRLGEMPGLRVVNKFFGRPTMVCLCALILTWFSVAAITGYRSDLAQPTRIGSDTSNYFAAGERLNDGHDLYALQPGDRPVANGTDANPWKYPLLSPPPIAVLWRPLALLGDLSIYLWWGIGAILMAAVTLWLCLRLNRGPLLALAALALPWGIEMWSGNLNLYLIPATALIWVAQRNGRSGTAGMLAGVAAVLKLMPAILLWWLILQRDWRAVRFFAATVAVSVLVSVLVAGIDAHLRYLSVAREANSVSLTWMSSVEWAKAVGISPNLAPVTPYVLAGACALVAWAYRKRPARAWAWCIVGLTLGTPDLRLDTITWVVAAMVPFATAPLPFAGLLSSRRRSADSVAPGGRIDTELQV